MTTLVPHGYGGFPSYQFSPPSQFANRYHHDGHRSRRTAFAPSYPVQPFYQPPFNAFQRHKSYDLSQARQPGFMTQTATFLNNLNEQYQNEQNLRRLNKINSLYSKLPTKYQPPEAIYEYEKETKFVPYPILVGPGSRNYRTAGNLGFGTYLNTFSGGSGTANLAPKIRVIFIPTGQSSMQQLGMGPLAMPPFLYSRMAQPLCSFPLPPPLPQLGSLPLTPAVQQMVMQQYCNPIFVLPFAPQWQIPQLMMPSNLQVPQYQEQLIPPMLPTQLFPTTPQSYLPSSMPILPSLPPAQQLPIHYPSGPALPMQSFLSDSSYIPPSAPVSAYSFLPSAPQSYIPSPPTMPSNLFVSPTSSSQPALPYDNAALSLPQYLNNCYPSICRACPPAPPPLSVSVTGHCWIQHCAACHHVPNSIFNQNMRPVNGRITPLLRHPTVPQYVIEQTGQQQQHLQSQTPPIIRPWLRRTPPLPPGSILISDEYIDRSGLDSHNYRSYKRHRSHQHSSRPKHRSATIASRIVSTRNRTSVNNSKSMPPRSSKRNIYTLTQHQASFPSTSISASNTSASGLSAKYQKITKRSSDIKPKDIPQKLTSEDRSINLQYSYQPQQVPSVYHVNTYLKSTSKDSSLTSNLGTSSDCFPSRIKEHSQLSSPSSDLNPMKEYDRLEKIGDKPSHSPSSSKQRQEKLIIIREFITNSPSTVSTISSNIAFSVIDKNTDLVSRTESLKTNKSEEHNIPHD